VSQLRNGVVILKGQLWASVLLLLLFSLYILLLRIYVSGLINDSIRDSGGCSSIDLGR
jgi:hypothetical protein